MPDTLSKIGPVEDVAEALVTIVDTDSSWS